MDCKSILLLIGFRKFNILIIKSSNSADKNPNVTRDEGVVSNQVAQIFKLVLVIRIRTRRSIYTDIKVKPPNSIKIN